MPPRFLLDEQLRGEVIWWAICGHNAAVAGRHHRHEIRAIRVGDAGAPPLSTSDPSILLWAERANRIVITIDRKTMPKHLADHYHSGRRLPGVFFLDRSMPVQSAIDFLEEVAGASEDDEWWDRVLNFP